MCSEVAQNVASKREDNEQQIPVTEIKQEELPDNLEKVYKVCIQILICMLVSLKCLALLVCWLLVSLKL